MRQRSSIASHVVICSGSPVVQRQPDMNVSVVKLQGAAKDSGVVVAYKYILVGHLAWSEVQWTARHGDQVAIGPIFSSS